MAPENEELSPGAEPGAEGASPSSTTSAAEIAERIARESTEAVPRSSAGQAAPSDGAAAGDGAAKLVDRWGRAFDKTLHLTKGDGTPATRNGTLITLKGKQGSGPGVRIAAPAGNVEEQRRLALEAARAAAGGGQAGAESTAEGDGKPSQATEPLPQLSPEEFQRRAKAGARFVRKVMARLGRWMAGDEGEYQAIDGVHEGQEIEDNTFDAQMEHQKLVPAGSLVLLLFSTGAYVGRCWASEKHQERVDDLVARITGQAKPKKPEQPATKPGAGAPPAAPPAEPPAKAPGDQPVRVVPTF